mgnify:FL=1
MRIHTLGVFLLLMISGAIAAVEPLALQTGTALCSVAGPDGTTLYIGTRGGGLYHLVPGSLTWESVPVPGTSPVIRAVAVGPDNEELIVGTDYGAMRSTDAGTSWTPICEIPVISCTVQTQGGLSSSILLGSRGSGLLRFDIATGTLTPLTRGYPISQVRGVLWTPNEPDRIVLGTQSGVFVSSDAGVTWIPRNTGLGLLPVRAICMDPAKPEILFVTTQEKDSDVSENGKLYRSTDAGLEWSLVFSEVCLTDVAVDPYHAGRVAVSSWYSGVFISEANGDADSWVPRIDGLTPKRTYCVSFLSEGLFAGTCGGVFRQITTEGPWTLIDSGFKAANVRKLRNVPGSPSAWYAACSENGLWRSIDNGATWLRAMSGFQPLHHDVTDIEIDPVNPVYMYTAMNGFFVYRSSNAGDTWSFLDPGGYLVIEDVAVDRYNPGRIYAAGFFNGLYRSNNRGDSWESATDDMTWLGCASTLTLPPDGSIVLVGQHDGDYDRSIDGGASYTHVKINPGIWYRTDVNEMLMASQDGSRILFATDRGIHISTDFGQSVSPATPEMSVVVFYSLAVAPSNNSIVYAGGDHGKIVRSTDGGVGWSVWEAASGLPDAPVKSIQVDALSADQILAGLNGYGVYRITP